MTSVTMVAAAVAMGVAGSLHCVAMCGPLAALAGRAPGRLLRYHGGRLLAYAVLGLVAGAAGASIAQAGFGRGLALAAGVALLVQAASASSWVAGGAVGQRLAAAATTVVRTGGAWLRRHGVQGPFALGLLNGLLPCGLLYAALTAAVGLGSVALGVIFMIAFGLGTVPLLSLIGAAAGTIAARLPVRVQRAGPVVLAFVGLLLIVRALAASQGAGHGH